jgi:hypothetical protein
MLARKQVLGVMLLISAPLVSFQLLDPDKSDSTASVYRKASAVLTTPESGRRLEERREMQRHGYASTLHDAIRYDGLSALIAYIRVKIQIEYSLDHTPIYYNASADLPDPPTAKRSGTPSFSERIISLLESRTPNTGPAYETVLEDWSFPPDPWKKGE